MTTRVLHASLTLSPQFIFSNTFLRIDSTTAHNYIHYFSFQFRSSSLILINHTTFFFYTFPSFKITTISNFINCAVITLIKLKQHTQTFDSTHTHTINEACKYTILSVDFTKYLTIVLFLSSLIFILFFIRFGGGVVYLQSFQVVITYNQAPPMSKCYLCDGTRSLHFGCLFIVIF